MNVMEPIQNPTLQSVESSPLINSPKPNWIYIILSTLITVLLGLIIFLFLQNQQLKKLSINQQLSQTVQPVSPTPKTVSSITVPTDETADWEIYTNNENGYLIKFPQSDFTRLGCIGEELTAEKYGSNNRSSPMTMISCERDSRYDLETKTYTSIQVEPEETKYYNIVKKDIQLGGVSGKLYVYTFTNIEDGPFPKWFATAKVNKNNKTYEIYLGDKSKLYLFDQILSTFKFADEN